MNTAIAISTEAPKVFSKDGRLVTTSQSVADYFDKQHKDVLRKIDMLDCSPEFTSANFCADVQTVEVGNGAERESRCYLITKDGFMFLVMGFTGKKAARLKEAYIAKFNAMEAELHKITPAATSRANYAVITYFENGLPVACHPLMPGEVVMNPDSCLEHVIRSGYVVMPCDEAEKFTLGEIQEMIAIARRARDRWLQP
ncbi:MULTISPECIES: Rha family transcriptional regulator [unclassified Enterobacter cloacae complex]|uniref:Rha family transcriptional regulator n=1 Tax=unclassified Enterobacter cloacae complex TaxID=2757714 RepID=UPI001874D988|nr:MULTISPECIES: Rha family transcriptional regulator [unclassified Enterobacter cloacae complex]MBE4946037.1 Rha family transcriptional regulator [Enterobacter cloacae complex sp. P1B]MBE4970050.1 Rha family transcriptional regulator [Enterobacter cloacae complex sp. P11RS]